MADKCYDEFHWGSYQSHSGVLLHLVRRQQSAGILTIFMSIRYHLQELKGKILLKAKKIGGLEGRLDETLTDDVSDEEEMANGDAESPSAEDLPAESLKQNEKVPDSSIRSKITCCYLKLYFF